jgi:hypothetical protein
MLAHEFETQITPEGMLKVPDELKASLPPGQTVRVLVLAADGIEDEDWKRLTLEQFLKGYADEDAVYDQLSTG